MQDHRLDHKGERIDITDMVYAHPGIINRRTRRQPNQLNVNPSSDQLDQQLAARRANRKQARVSRKRNRQ